jgi:hypothetical protein
VELHVKFLSDASKNVAVWVRGRVGPLGVGEPSRLVEFFDMKKLSPDPHGKSLRTLLLASALWTLQEKLGFYVWTSSERKPEHLLLLMESRNAIRFEREMTLDDWKGKLYLEPFNVTEVKWFWFQLEFDKVLER